MGLLCSITIAVQAKTSKFTILSFNDVYEIVPDDNGRGGFAEMQTLLQRERAKSDFHITTMNGDFLSPCILSSIDHGAHRIELFNMMGIDLVVLGNHEFDFGPDVVLKRIRESHFPWLAANAIGLDGKPFTGDLQNVIVEADGVKIGFFGVITPETSELSSTEQKVCFAPIVYTAKQKIAELRSQGADVIVALTHLLFSEDKMLGDEVPEIDVILGGHDHEPITWYNDRTFIHKSGQNAYYLARVDLTIEKDDVSGRVKVFPSWEIILNKDIPRDPLVGAKVDEFQSLLDHITSEPIGVVGMEFDTMYVNVRSKETKIGNLVADALRVTSGADVSMVAGGIIRGNKLYEPGDVFTYKDVLSEFPFGNLSVVIEVPGSAILAALENGVSQVEGKAGRFPQVSGMSFAYDLNQVPGSRIQEVFIQGAPLELTKLYKVATVDYMFHGGDGYGMFKGGRVLLSPLKGVSLVSNVVDYVKSMPLIETGLDGRIVIKSVIKKLDDIAGVN